MEVHVMKARTAVILAGAILAAACLTAQDPAEAPRIQIAILLDTSNSMDGLIDQARSQLWKVVNGLATASKDGLEPDLEVALYEYGNNSLSKEDGYIRLVLPLTTDLDRVSEELFALTTNGGDEYCGHVIQRAVADLDWSDSFDDMKAIFIAGNEPFTQGSVDYRDSCGDAIDRGIVVSTIHCGTLAEGERTGWRDGALLADGSYMAIDQNTAVAHVAAPQDDEIARLGSELNDTYVPYGADGPMGAGRQGAEDSKASTVAPGTATQRAVFKSSKHYKNASWDLVDAVKQGEASLEELEPEELPEKMRGMTPEEQQVFLDGQQQRREQLQQRIQELNDARKKYVAAKQKEAAEKGKDTLDVAMIQSIQEQAKKKNFDLE
jgi:hypothetical protein